MAVVGVYWNKEIIQGHRNISYSAWVVHAYMMYYGASSSNFCDWSSPGMPAYLRKPGIPKHAG